jgi:hypothetical protein
MDAAETDYAHDLFKFSWTDWGGSGKGYWRIASSGILHVALPNTYWTHLRLTISQTWQRLYQTA